MKVEALLGHATVSTKVTLNLREDKEKEGKGDERETNQNEMTETVSSLSKFLSTYLKYDITIQL